MFRPFTKTVACWRSMWFQIVLQMEDTKSKPSCLGTNRHQRMITNFNIHIYLNYFVFHQEWCFSQNPPDPRVIFVHLFGEWLLWYTVIRNLVALDGTSSCNFQLVNFCFIKKKEVNIFRVSGNGVFLWAKISRYYSSIATVKRSPTTFFWFENFLETA